MSTAASSTHQAADGVRPAGGEEDVSVPQRRLWRRGSDEWRRTAVGVGVIVALLAAGNVISPGFGSAQNVGSLFAIAVILVLMALAQVVVVVAGGEGIDLSVAAVASMSAVLASIWLARGAGGIAGVGAALVAVLALGAFVGLVNGLGIAFARVPPLVMTLGMSQVVAGSVFAYTSGSAPELAPDWLAEVGSGRVFAVVRWLVVVAAVAVTVGEVVLRRSRGGRALFLVGANPRAAELSGLRVNVTRIVAYVVSGAIGAFGGILLLANSGSAQLGMADGYQLLSVAAVIIGGAKFSGGEGSFVGAAIGAVILTILDSLLIAVGFSAGERTAVQGAILLVLTIVYAREKSLRA